MGSRSRATLLVTSITVATSALVTPAPGTAGLAQAPGAGGALGVPAHSSFDPLDSGDPVQVRTLSGRADLVSGGDAFFEIVLPPHTDRSAVRVLAADRDVTDRFRPGGPGLRGLVTELPVGHTTIAVSLPDGNGASLDVTNAPQGGPVFSGPLIEPWTCGNGSQVPDCSTQPSVSYLYRSTDPAKPGMQPYDPADPPGDVDSVVTDEGNRVPFVVRHEVGFSLRDQYRIAALWTPPPDDPGAAPDPTADNPGYGGKLVLTHGASCDTAYESGSAPDVVLQDALAQGFAVASHALDNAGHNCNLVTQAESLIMTKEMVVERFGPLRYTIGTGCSGGSLVQQQVANAYPGVFQGILPQCSFPDAWSSAQQYVDYVGLRAYLEDPAKLLEHGITPVQWPAIFGHINPVNWITFTTVIANSGDPSRPCPGLPATAVYNAASNPTGVRCSLHDYMRNVFGVYEDGPHQGHARRPISNVGIQYGLAGLLSFLNGDLTDLTRPPLTPDQFVALNLHGGGYDLDFNPTAARTEADPLAMERVYRSGAVNTGAHMDEVAIIDLGGPEPGAFHDVFRKYVMRERLIREHGTAANQVLWEGQTPVLGDIAFRDSAIAAMDRWLAAVEAAGRDVPLAQRIIDAKAGAGIADRCVAVGGLDVPLDVCDLTVDATIFSSPRIEAGGGDQAPVNGLGPAVVGFTDDRLDCETMPIEAFVYAGQAFTQVFSPAQQAALRSAFPDGVCDYSRPGRGFQAAVPWLRYQDAAGAVVYGGEPMGGSPRSVYVVAAPSTSSPPADGTSALPATGGGPRSPALLLLVLAAGVAACRRRVGVRRAS